MNKLIFILLCTIGPLSANAQTLKIGSTRAQVERALGIKLERSLISLFSETFEAIDTTKVKGALPESLRSYDIKSAVFSFGRGGKLWRVYVNIELPADDAFAAYEATSNILTRMYNAAPRQKGISDAQPVIEECRDRKGHGSAVPAGFKNRWSTFSQAQREAFTLNCGGGSVPVRFDQHTNKNRVAEVVSFEGKEVFFFLGEPDELVARFLAQPSVASVVYRLIQTSKEAPSFANAETDRIGQ